MSAGQGYGPPDPGGREPSEEELRAAYEAELSRLTSTDMLIQSVVSLLNVGGLRLGLPAPGAPAGGQGAGPTRDLEQVRDAIDGVLALLPILERRAPADIKPVRDALSQLQMAYAREVQAAGSSPSAASATPPSPPSTPSGAAPGDPAEGAGPAPAAPAADRAAGTSPAPSQSPGTTEDKGPGPAESSGRLWVPGR